VEVEQVVYSNDSARDYNQEGAMRWFMGTAPRQVQQSWANVLGTTRSRSRLGGASRATTVREWLVHFQSLRHSGSRSFDPSSARPAETSSSRPTGREECATFDAPLGVRSIRNRHQLWSYMHLLGDPAFKFVLVFIPFSFRMPIQLQSAYQNESLHSNAKMFSAIGSV